MAQAFETTYKRYYRNHNINRRNLIRPVDRFAELLPESGNWLIIKSLEEQKQSGLPLTEVENAVKNMYRQRLYSTYQLAYCSKDIPKEEYILETSENELLRLADELYAKKSGPVLPTRPTSRRVFGYLRPAYTYTPLTMYQLVHGKTAYRILKYGTEAAYDLPRLNEKLEGARGMKEIKPEEQIEAAENIPSDQHVLKESPGHIDLIPKPKSSTVKCVCSCK